VQKARPAGRWRPCKAMITAHKQMSHDDWDRPVPLEPRGWYPSTGAPEMTGQNPLPQQKNDSADGT